MDRPFSILLPLLLAGFLLSHAHAQPLHVPIETAAQDKAFSEFNHHLAGWFVLSIGMLAFLAAYQPELSSLGRIWPFLFMAAGVYLAFMSDPDVWPMGPQG